MLGLDIAVGVIVLGLFVAGGAAIKVAVKKQRASDPEVQAKLAQEKGKKNLRRMEARESMRCASCDQFVDPEVDVFYVGQWWHHKCYRKVDGELK